MVLRQYKSSVTRYIQAENAAPIRGEIYQTMKQNILRVLNLDLPCFWIQEQPGVTPAVACAEACDWCQGCSDQGATRFD